MTSHETDAAFWDRADAILNLANQQCDTVPRGQVSSSLLYSAARFNAFVVASHAKDSAKMAADRDEAVAYFTAQYKMMLEENLDNFIAHYDEYIRR